MCIVVRIKSMYAHTRAHTPGTSTRGSECAAPGVVVRLQRLLIAVLRLLSDLCDHFLSCCKRSVRATLRCHFLQRVRPVEGPAPKAGATFGIPRRTCPPRCTHRFPSRGSPAGQTCPSLRRRLRLFRSDDCRRERTCIHRGEKDCLRPQRDTGGGGVDVIARCKHVDG